MKTVHCAILIFMICIAIASCFLAATVHCIVGQIREESRARLHVAMSSGAEPTLDPEAEADTPPWRIPGDMTVGDSDPHDSRWDGVVRNLKKTEPDAKCAACGGDGPINWHHIKPWHMCTGKDAELRYDRKNLIPLCTDPRRKCHWIFGHLGFSWSADNPDVVKQSAEHLESIDKARKRLNN